MHISHLLQQCQLAQHLKCGRYSHCSGEHSFQSGPSRQPAEHTIRYLVQTLQNRWNVLWMECCTIACSMWGGRTSPHTYLLHQLASGQLCGYLCKSCNPIWFLRKPWCRTVQDVNTRHDMTSTPNRTHLQTLEFQKQIWLLVLYDSQHDPSCNDNIDRQTCSAESFQLLNNLLHNLWVPCQNSCFPWSRKCMPVLNVLFCFCRPVSFCVFINPLVDSTPIQVMEELQMVET